MESDNMLGDNPTGKKATREALIEAQIVALFQKKLPDTIHKQYGTLLWDKTLKQDNPQKWVKDMSSLLGVQEPEGFASMTLEQQKLSAMLLARYIDKARTISGTSLSRTELDLGTETEPLPMPTKSSPAEKHSQSTSTPVVPTEQNASDAMAAKLKKLNSRFEALGFDGAETPSQNPSNKQSVQPLTLQRSAHEATNPSSAPKPAKAAVLAADEMQEKPSTPRPK